MSATAPRIAPLHLWRQSATLLTQLFTLFGEPFIEHHADNPEAWRVSFRFFTELLRAPRNASRRGRRRSIIERDSATEISISKARQALLGVDKLSQARSLIRHRQHTTALP